MSFKIKKLEKTVGNPDRFGVYYRGVYHFGDLVAELRTHPNSKNGWPVIIAMHHSGKLMMASSDSKALELIETFLECEARVHRQKFLNMVGAVGKANYEWKEWWESARELSEGE